MTDSHACAMAALQAAPPGVILVVAAHSDDETIGIGATLGTLAAAGWSTRIVHVTDSAPHKVELRFALRHRSRDEMKIIRRAEAEAAVRAGGLDPNETLLPLLDVADQEATFAMPILARAIMAHLRELRPTVVVTHPYEGGHPDHDAAALAVHAAVALHGAPVALAEMTSYHTQQGTLVTGAFRRDSRAPCESRPVGVLDDASRARKRRMLDAYPTQAEILAPFRDETEHLRCAPRYDFAKAPHEGTLHYESLPFDWTGSRWREHAVRALDELGLTGRAI